MGVWLVTGVQAAGKSTVADLLARQFDRGVHVRGGAIQRDAGFQAADRRHVVAAVVLAVLRREGHRDPHLRVL